ncbi:penicillin-binding transpeptidase domain-containing protein [Candidatus Thiothrix anitrata]|uniref:penicillin-binding transpeptidase domain-containing protein n=1 Tax=Candidatus Thiothrix anitrata TaxID=2823902 RepID=UPI00224BA93A|nr:penicillin-binding transpeptidase domain-containing protein [Candidatus Thiothrix anitrata]
MHGQAGYHLVEVDAHGKQQALVDEKAPVGGQDLFLGLDINLQMTGERLLKNEKGAIVAIDPSNGEILALVSMPTFDPNLFINGITHKDYVGLRDDPDRPLYNWRCRGFIRRVQPLSRWWASQGWQKKLLPRVHGYLIRVSSVYPAKHVFRCWNKRGHGSVDLKVAITQSCDTFFYDLAYRMGIDRFSTFMRTFGFGERTGIDLPSEATGLMPSQEWKQRRHKSSWYPETRLISVSGRVIGYLHRCNWRTRQRLWRITVNA